MWTWRPRPRIGKRTPARSSMHAVSGGIRVDRARHRQTSAEPSPSAQELREPVVYRPYGPATGRRRCGAMREAVAWPTTRMPAVPMWRRSPWPVRRWCAPTPWARPGRCRVGRRGGCPKGVSHPGHGGAWGPGPHDRRAGRSGRPDRVPPAPCGDPTRASAGHRLDRLARAPGGGRWPDHRVLVWADRGGRIQPLRARADGSAPLAWHRRARGVRTRPGTSTPDTLGR